jgi:hypothetical protein
LSDERGREDGFIHRILFAMPATRALEWTDEDVDQETHGEYAKVVQGLQALSGEAVVMHFTREGKATWREWITGHYDEMNALDFPSALRGPWAKLEGYCARLALILQLTRAMCRAGTVRDDVVDEASVAGAATLVDGYFKDHTRSVYSRLHESPHDRRVGLALQWITRHGGEVSARELLTYKVAGCSTAREVEALLADLVERGLGTVRKESPPGGGRIRKVFRVHT